MKSKEAREITDRVLDKVPNLESELKFILSQIRAEAASGSSTYVIGYRLETKEDKLLNAAIISRLRRLGYRIVRAEGDYSTVQW